MNQAIDEMDVEIQKQYARLIAVIDGFENQGMSDSEQLTHVKGLVGAQYAFLAGLMSEEFHTEFMYMIYDKAGIDGDHRFARLFEN